MGRPGTTPKPATPPSPSRGRPGAVKVPYLLDDHASDLLLIDPIVETKKVQMVDLKLTQTAAEFESIVDSHYPDKSTTPYPPAGKVPDPLETQLDTELGLNPTPVTLAELDGILSLFLTENRSLDGLPMATPANRDAFYQRQRHVGDIKAKQINMQTHWRAQQDLLNREAMLQLAKALQK